MTDLQAPVCWACVVGFHEECYAPELADENEPVDGQPWVVCCCKNNKTPEAQDFVNGVGRPMSDPSDIKDPTSTGRKRAAMLYPIMDGMICEWAYLKFAGGGVKPIIGCDGNLIYSERGKGGRHHGPDKNVIINDPGNVHRICMTCHNRWHALNNEFYGPRPAADQQYLPLPEFECKKHDPDTRATDEEREENEEWWATAKIDRVDSED